MVQHAFAILLLNTMGLFPAEKFYVERFLSVGKSPGTIVYFVNITSHCRASVRILSTSMNQSGCEYIVKNCLNSCNCLFTDRIHKVTS